MMQTSSDPKPERIEVFVCKEYCHMYWDLDTEHFLCVICHASKGKEEASENNDTDLFPMFHFW